MKNPHSHPAHRNVKPQPQADHPNMTDEAKARSDRWARELDAEPAKFCAKYERWIERNHQPSGSAP